MEEEEKKVYEVYEEEEVKGVYDVPGIEEDAGCRDDEEEVVLVLGVDKPELRGDWPGSDGVS